MEQGDFCTAQGFAPVLPHAAPGLSGRAGRLILLWQRNGEEQPDPHFVSNKQMTWKSIFQRERACLLQIRARKRRKKKATDVGPCAGFRQNCGSRLIPPDCVVYVTSQKGDGEFAHLCSRFFFALKQSWILLSSHHALDWIRGSIWEEHPRRKRRGATCLELRERQRKVL